MFVCVIFLMKMCGSDRGWWLPAGHVDPNESFQDGARRETWEEAGIDVNLVTTLQMPTMIL